ncbi:cytochrome P450 [Micromonospora sp. M12]
MISRLLTEQIGPGNITPQEAMGLGMMVLIAGHETSANMIGLSILKLLEHPEHYAALRETRNERRRSWRSCCAT